MRPTHTTTTRPFFLCGAAGSELFFCTPSWSRKGIDHDQIVDLDDLTVRCNCEDSTTRKKLSHLDTTKGNRCKHVAALTSELRRIFETT